MSGSSLESQRVPVDVLPPLPQDAYGHPPVTSEKEPPLAGFRSFYHPASGVAILGVDLLCFGPEVAFPFDLPVMCALAFAITFPLVYLIQWKWGRNGRGVALGKALFGAFLAGLPFSITGTMFGAAVLALSGLPHNPVEAFKRITGRSTVAAPR